MNRRRLTDDKLFILIVPLSLNASHESCRIQFHSGLAWSTGPNRNEEQATPLTVFRIGPVFDTHQPAVCLLRVCADMHRFIKLLGRYSRRTQQRLCRSDCEKRQWACFGLRNEFFRTRLGQAVGITFQGRSGLRALHQANRNTFQAIAKTIPFSCKLKPLSFP